MPVAILAAVPLTGLRQFSFKLSGLVDQDWQVFWAN
jgi:hypothetical protein